MNLQQRLAQLHEMWPELQWTDARLIECDHDVLILDERLVFRFACEDPEHEPLEREVRFLEKLRGRAELPVPNYTYVDPEFRAAGYPRLPGESLTLGKWDALRRDQQRQVAVGVAQVLDPIHSFPIEAAAALGVPRTDSLKQERAWFLYLYLQIVRRGELTEKEMAYCDRVTHPLVAALEEIPARVTHGDIAQVLHILHDGSRFTGVIDFGDVVLGDPAADIGSLWELGETFVDDVLASHSQASEALKQRSYLWWFGQAIAHLECGARLRSEEDWESGYRLFPPDVTDPQRTRRCW